MKLIYGRIQLDLLTIDAVNRTAVWTPDGSTLLYNEWDITCSCIYAPQVGALAAYGQHMGGTSVNLVSVPGAAEIAKPASASSAPNPADYAGTRPDPDKPPITQGGTLQATFPVPGTVGGGGKLEASFTGSKPPPILTYTMPGSEYPVVTDRVLQTELAIPRQRLVITAWDPIRQTDIYWLVSPDFDRTSDAKNGPIVKASPVVQLHGDGQAFGVQLNITTWIPPCAGGADKAILAHRWQMNHTEDEDFYLTRNVTGEIYFNASIFNDLDHGVRADFLTKEMFHPIPFGFRRKIDFVRRSPDGLVIAYGYTDTDQTVTFDASTTGATQIQVHETSAYIAPFTGLTWGINQIRDLGAKIGGLF